MSKQNINQKWWIFFGGSLMILLVNIDATIVNLALASIARDLHTNLAQIQWLINSYLLTAMIFFIIGGKLSDIFGQKKIFLIGTVFFTLASLLAGLAPNFPILIIARLLQGVGFAFTLSLAILMISAAFPSNQRGFVVGLSITITGLGQALGPTIGGVILQGFNWHWIFLINVPIAALSFFIIYLFGVHKSQGKEGQTIDYIGAILLGVALSILLLAMNTLTGGTFNIKLFVIGLALSLLILLVFYWKEIKTTFPLIDFKLFRDRDYALSILIRFLFMYTLGVFLFFIPLYLQNILGYSPLIAGLMILVYSALFGISSPMAGIWCDAVGYKTPLIFCSAVGVLAFTLLATTNAHSSIHITLLGMLFVGVNAGILIPATVNSTISSVPETSRGEGLGMFFTVAFIGLSLGVAISGAQLNIVSLHNLALHQKLLANLGSEALSLMHRAANGTLPITKLSIHAHFDQYSKLSELAKQSFTKGLSSIMWVNAILLLIVTMLTIMLKKRIITNEK